MKFELIPFPSDHLPKVIITGEIKYTNDQLSIQYQLCGDLENILIPVQSTAPKRKDELWKETCFEFFMAIKDQPEYWEFNMSPSGDWNVYHMDAYRRIGFREETSIQHLEFEAFNNADMFALKATIDLKPILQDSKPLEIGITAILQTKDGNQSYWALTHPAPYPDFHLRESFILALEGQTHLAGQSAQGD